jgi:hypothetical protein
VAIASIGPSGDGAGKTRRRRDRDGDWTAGAGSDNADRADSSRHMWESPIAVLECPYVDRD